MGDFEGFSNNPFDFVILISGKSLLFTLVVELSAVLKLSFYDTKVFNGDSSRNAYVFAL